MARPWRITGGCLPAPAMPGNFDEGKGISRHLLGGVEWRPVTSRSKPSSPATTITAKQAGRTALNNLQPE